MLPYQRAIAIAIVVVQVLPLSIISILLLSSHLCNSSKRTS
jgi:hypothetical protein